jgi:hypothetical protein
LADSIPADLMGDVIKGEYSFMSWQDHWVIIIGFEQTFEIEKGQALWTRSQNLDADQVLSFTCH